MQKMYLCNSCIGALQCGVYFSHNRISIYEFHSILVDAQEVQNSEINVYCKPDLVF